MSALAFVIAAALSSAPPSPSASGAASLPLAQPERPVFARPEPHIDAGAALLRAGDAEGALVQFRKAATQNAHERAIVEFDVGQALVVQAQQTAQAAPDADGGAQKIDVSDARAAFDRAYGLAWTPALKSEAQLASGNAAALGGDIDGAISAYRKALVADPTNARAKKNLLRVLAAKKAQPPPPPSEGGDSGDSNDGDKNDEQKDPQDEQKDPKDPKQGDQKDPQKDPQDGGGQGGKDPKQKDPQKDPQQQQQGGGQGDEPDEQKKDEQDGQNKGEQDDTQDDKQGKGAPQPQPKQQRKEDAKKLLDALRSRERPLTPLEMRGTQKGRPKAGKDW